MGFPLSDVGGRGAAGAGDTGRLPRVGPPAAGAAAPEVAAGGAEAGSEPAVAAAAAGRSEACVGRLGATGAGGAAAGRGAAGGAGAGAAGAFGAGAAVEVDAAAGRDVSGVPAGPVSGLDVSGRDVSVVTLAAAGKGAWRGAGSGEDRITPGSEEPRSELTAPAPGAEAVLEVEARTTRELAGGSAGAGASSVIGARRRPSASALRRTRSAWASSMLEEWLLTPIPSAKQRSSASLFSRPSSRAS
ncbi:MAG TPA: hypothetical protein VNF50_02075, partial [Acidimicrobiales bacterium]|nr:hypothetical protein [Acidimicrobiales bacterium]